MPPLLGPLLTGPVPPWAARLATHWPAVGAALVAPLVIGVVFLRAPVLPNSAVEVGPADGPVHVVRGQLIAVDDTSTTVLQRDGEVTFVPNDQVRSKTLCPEPLRGAGQRRGGPRLAGRVVRAGVGGADPPGRRRRSRGASAAR